MFDYNADGRPDIFFTNGAKTPSLEKSSPIYSNRLYRNDGGMRFTDVTTAAGLSGAGYAIGAAAGDFDNDGHVDLFVAGVGAHQLYRNRGDGRFDDITKAAGIASGEFAVGGGWFDYDNDGRLDLLVVNYVQWSADKNPSCGDEARGSSSTATRACSRDCRTVSTAIAATARSRMSARTGLQRRQGDERIVRRFRPRWPSRHLRHQRRGAELSLPQQWRRHVHGIGIARGSVGAGHGPSDFQHGRRCPGLRQRRLGGHPVHGADGGDVSALPQRVGQEPRDRSSR